MLHGNFYQCQKKIGLGGIPSFESVLIHGQPHVGRRRIITCQRYLVGERLFVGRHVEITDNHDHASRDGVSNRIVHKTCDDKDMHPCVTTREDG